MSASTISSLGPVNSYDNRFKTKARKSLLKKEVTQSFFGGLVAIINPKPNAPKVDITSKIKPITHEELSSSEEEASSSETEFRILDEEFTLSEEESLFTGEELDFLEEFGFLEKSSSSEDESGEVPLSPQEEAFEEHFDPSRLELFLNEGVVTLAFNKKMPPSPVQKALEERFSDTTLVSDHSKRKSFLNEGLSLFFSLLDDEVPLNPVQEAFEKHFSEAMNNIDQISKEAL